MMRTNNALSKNLLVASDMAYAAGKPEGVSGKPLGPYADTPAYDYSPRFAWDNRFTIIQSWADQASGFKALLFKNAATNELILAFGGTDGPDPQDWAANSLHLGWNQWNLNRKSVLDTVKDRLTEMGGGALLHITGQSLGGGLAEYAAYDLLTKNGSSVVDADLQSRVTVTTLTAWVERKY